jgi:hypothetical protein
MWDTKLHDPERRSAVRGSVAPWLRGSIGAGAAILGHEWTGTRCVRSIVDMCAAPQRVRRTCKAT